MEQVHVLAEETVVHDVRVRRTKVTPRASQETSLARRGFTHALRFARVIACHLVMKRPVPHADHVPLLRLRGGVEGGPVSRAPLHALVHHRVLLHDHHRVRVFRPAVHRGEHVHRRGLQGVPSFKAFPELPVNHEQVAYVNFFSAHQDHFVKDFVGKRNVAPLANAKPVYFIHPPCHLQRNMAPNLRVVTANRRRGDAFGTVQVRIAVRLAEQTTGNGTAEGERESENPERDLGVTQGRRGRLAV